MYFLTQSFGLLIRLFKLVNVSILANYAAIKCSNSTKSKFVDGKLPVLGNEKGQLLLLGFPTFALWNNKKNTGILTMHWKLIL